VNKSQFLEKGKNPYLHLGKKHVVESEARQKKKRKQTCFKGLNEGEVRRRRLILKKGKIYSWRGGSFL